MNEPKPNSLSLVDRAAIFFATGCMAGFLPTYVLDICHRPKCDELKEKKWTGAGLIGAIEGGAMYLLLPESIAKSWAALGIACLFSVAAAHVAEKALNSHDDSRIIIDEWVGVWLAMMGLHQHLGWPILIAFALFRLFDVFKGPVGRALQKVPGGWGVTVDDLYAGIVANLLCRLIVSRIPALSSLR